MTYSNFYSRRIYLASRQKTDVLSIPANVRVKCLAIRTSASAIMIGANADPLNTGMNLQPGESMEFSDGDLSTLDGAPKSLYAYASGITYVEIMGVVEVAD